MLVPQIMDDMVKVLNLIPQERVLRRTVEKMVDGPVPQIQEQINEVIKVDKTTEELRREVSCGGRCGTWQSPRISRAT